MRPNPEVNIAADHYRFDGVLRRIALLLLLGAGSGGASAVNQPSVSLIIDDMGNRRVTDLAAIRLPGPVAYAFLPHSPHAAELATLAFEKNKEVLLHVPMQATSKRKLGPGGITATMNRVDLMQTVSAGLKSVPYVSGINNHMGSMVTSRHKHMGWLMDLMRVRGNLYFVDSRTTRHTIALDTARSNGIPSTWRDVFLDNELIESNIKVEFARLIEIARKRGTALAIGHPHETTVSYLAEMIPRLKALGIRLVPVARLIQLRGEEMPPFDRTTSRAIHAHDLVAAPGPETLTQSSASGQAAITK
ncbi:MAG TPA: divergent polysaccharide deacetylase family protein [Gammaproteobacteria bacterium]